MRNDFSGSRVVVESGTLQPAPNIGETSWDTERIARLKKEVEKEFEYAVSEFNTYRPRTTSLSVNARNELLKSKIRLLSHFYFDKKVE